MNWLLRLFKRKPKKKGIEIIDLIKVDENSTNIKS